MTLPDARVGPGKDAALVQEMFDRVAPRYDLANTLFSLGQDAHWRRVAGGAAHLGPGDLAVDVAAGTGALAAGLAARGARVVAADFSWKMLLAGRDRAGVWPVTADALRLPLPDGVADAVTIAFGLRNLAEPAAGLREFARIARPGARLVVLEFSTPTWAPFRALYQRYLGTLPAAARFVTSHAKAYGYLAASIAAWPDQRSLAQQIADCGWAQVRWKNLSGGIVAVHRAVRP